MNTVYSIYQRISIKVDLFLIKKKAARFSGHHPYVLSTINGVGQLYKHKKTLSELSSQELDQMIVKITKLQPEPGLIYGITPREKERAIEDIAKTLIAGYKMSKKADKLDLFFDQAFESDPCFNARVGQLRNFLMSQNADQFPEGVLDGEKYSLRLANLLLNLMYEYAEGADKDAENLPPTFDELIAFIKNQPGSPREIIDLVSPVLKPEFAQLYSGAKEAFI